MPRKRRAPTPDDEEDDLICDEAPTSINPYDVLAVDKDATADQIKSAYRRAALKHHPDKAAEADKEEAHTKFQEIAFAYAILSDPRRRSRYDTTGRTEDSLEDEDDDFNWVDFFREQYAAVVTEETIANFSSGYKGSEEERGDVLKAYEKCEGDMNKLYQLVMLSEADEDDDRFRKIIKDAIEGGEVEEYTAFTQESEKKRLERLRLSRDRRAKEAKAADKAQEKEGEAKGGGKKRAKGEAGMGDLAALIQQRQQGRAENFLDGLEAKYAPKRKGGARDEPPEEAFERNRKKAKK